jgi:hypothetical protein
MTCRAPPRAPLARTRTSSTPNPILRSRWMKFLSGPDDHTASTPPGRSAALAALIDPPPKWWTPLIDEVGVNCAGIGLAQKVIEAFHAPWRQGAFEEDIFKEVMYLERQLPQIGCHTRSEDVAP